MQLTRDIRERVKELKVLHRVANLLLQDCSMGEELFEEFLALLPPGWQFPKICAARVCYGDMVVQTSNWADTVWMQSAPLQIGDGVEGRLDVAYLKKPPRMKKDPFLKEEYNLLQSLADMLTAHLKRRIAEEKIRRLAFFEPLTEMPNRVSMQTHLANVLTDVRKRRKTLALLLINLDNFSDINDTLGHQVGDALLKQVGINLSSGAWPSEMVASLGGDEYAVLLSCIRGQSEIHRILEEIMDLFRYPLYIGDLPINIDISIGVALYPDHGKSPEALWQRADVALRAAKAHRRGHQFYCSEIDRYDSSQILLLGKLHDAIARDELTLHYQPTVDMASGQTVSVEALVRWNHPDLGLVYPDRFVPLAEKTRMIHAMTQWVLDQALSQREQLLQEGLDISLAVNLSVRDLLVPDLVENILQRVNASRLPPERLILEITETAVMADPYLARKVLGELSEAGIRIAMDDFGIGQSSLTYLKDLPINKLKIDRSFMMDFDKPRNVAIVKAAIDLAHNLGLKVTAEGVESQATYRALVEMGCDLAQGYYIAKPMSLEGIIPWFRNSGWGRQPALSRLR
jgi:diguanylate cyclase (GGDEF)-like protein